MGKILAITGRSYHLKDQVAVAGKEPKHTKPSQTNL